MNLYNSTKAPEEPVAPKHPGEGANECQLATYNKKYAQWEKDHAAWETKMATWKAPTISSVDVAYAEQQIALWGPRLIKLDAVKTHLDAAIAMCTINPADASKYDAERWEAYSQAFAYAQNVSTSFNASTTMRTQVRETMNNLIYNWKRLIANPVVTVTFTFTVNGVTHAVLTGNQGDPVDLSTIAAPDAPVGMHFVSWGNVPATFDADATFEAVFANNTDTKYTVNVYNMDTTGAYPSAPDSTYQGAGETGSTADITAEAAPAEGFSLDSAKSVLTGTIAADGSLVLSIYYSRNQYTVTYANTDLAPDTYYYGATVVARTPEKAGHTFLGWEEEVPATMPANNVVLTAKWDELPANYDEYNIAVEAANAKKAEADYDKKYTADTRAALDTALNEDVSGKKLSEQSVVDAQTAKINAAVAGLKLMTYNAEFYVDNELYRTVATEVGAQIAAPEAPTKAGYTFTGWNPEVGVMGVEDVRFDAKFSAGTVGYKVETYVMGLDGNYGDAAIEDKSATTGETVSVTPKTREGFTVADNSVLSGTVLADGSLVLKVYYSRNQYKLSVDGVETDVYYGAALNVAEPAAREGYTFAGWNTDIPATMPAENLTLVSQWSENDADYTAYNAAVAAAQAKQAEENYDRKYTAETRAALAAVLAEDVSGKKYSEQGVVDAATQAINDAVAALELMTYTATFYVNGEVHATVTAKVGEQIAAPADPIVDGYNFTGWDPEVGTMGIENVSFNAILVANDSSIISVTPESPNYGGMHQYAIKVKGEPQKIRIVDAFGNTRTFDRNTSMTSDANALGILKIEKTDDGEIWTINVNIPEGRYVAFAKFGKDWEENGHNFSVRFDVKPEEPTPDGVLEVTYNTPNYGGKQEYTFKVSGKADKIQVVCADGGTITLSRLDPRVTVKSYDAEGIEVYSNSTNLAYEIWTVNLDIPAGRHIAKAKYGRSWTAGTEFDVIIDAKPVSAVSVTEVKTSADSVEVTVNGTATKIKIADASGATRTYDRDHADVSIAPDGDGEIWTINAKLRAGEYTATAKYIANDRQVWDTTDFAFTV